MLVFHTVRHLRPAQALSMVRYRLFGFRSPGVLTDGICRRDDVALAPPLIPNGSAPGQFDRHITFLHHRVELGATGVDWRSDTLPKLWRYNLHYFDFLLWPDVSTERRAGLIDDWIAKNPVGTEDAWEPYTASLRIVNWIKWFIEAPETVKPEWQDSLACQANWLSRNLETHILANHYLKNIKALVFAGAYLSGRDAERWLGNGKRLFVEQLKEQFMPSGAHYELSPMYHCICTEDLLDVANMAESNESLFDEDFTSEINATVERALDFLNSILMPDGQIPLFGDSAFGVAQEPARLFDYGEQLLGYRRAATPSKALTDAGYFVLRDRENRMVMKCGAPGPSYQPGHTHCDMLSFELSLGGKRVFTDTGVFDYENGTERAYSRDTRSHNTVSVEGHEQSEVWSVFRVARRARLIYAEVSSGSGSKARIEAEIEAFPAVRGSLRHRRVAEHAAGGAFRIVDTVSGDFNHPVEVSFHLAPGFSFSADDRHVAVLDADAHHVAGIRYCEDQIPRIDRGWCFPRFGLKQERQVLRFTKHGQFPTEMWCEIRPVRQTGYDSKPSHAL